MTEKKARLGKPAVVKTIDRSIPAEQLRDVKGKRTTDPSKDANGKSKVTLAPHAHLPWRAVPASAGVTPRVRAAVNTYWLVNPAGAVHMLPADHVLERLHQSKGWRMATQAEIAAYAKRGGNQSFDKPIAAPFVREPAADSPEIDLDELSKV